VIDGVAQKVAERSIELLQNVAIDLCRLPDDLQTNRLAERPADVAYQAREGRDAVIERPHAAR
jgi:hypothetical protein